MKSIKIENKLIGENKPCFIIAEAGVNHNGSLELAKKLVDAALEAGADAVKFQTFKSENFVTQNADMAGYQQKNTGEKQSQFEMLKKLELDYDDFTELKKYCDEKGIIFLSCPHTEDALDFLEPLVPAYKIGSGDLNNLPFLEKAAKKNKPIILSTGMSSLEEVKKAVETIKKAGNEDIILLHCVTNYHCPFEEVNLRSMLTLKKEFNLPAGYSDHTLGITASIAAVAMGAEALEKHFTTDKNLPGPDNGLSLEPKELKEMVKAVKDVEKALGTGIKEPTEKEKEFKEIVRKSIVAKRDIPIGTEITSDMLIIKRPGIGIKPEDIDKVAGRKTKTNIKKDQLISWEMI